VDQLAYTMVDCKQIISQCRWLYLNVVAKENDGIFNEHKLYAIHQEKDSACARLWSYRDVSCDLQDYMHKTITVQVK